MQQAVKSKVLAAVMAVMIAVAFMPAFLWQTTDTVNAASTGKYVTFHYSNCTEEQITKETIITSDNYYALTEKDWKEVNAVTNEDGSAVDAWYTSDSLAKDKLWKSGNNFGKIEIATKDTTDLYAAWAQQNWNVKFMVANGDGSGSAITYGNLQKVNNEAYAETPEDPNPDNYGYEGKVFAGWAILKEGVTEYTTANIVDVAKTKITQDTSFVAIFADDEVYEVSFFVDEEEYAKKYVEKGDASTLPNEPKANKGKEFLGWAKVDGNDYDSSNYDKNDVVDVVNTPITENSEYIAVFGDAAWDVIFYVDTTRYANIEKVADGTCITKVPKDPPAEDEMKFVGWAAVKYDGSSNPILNSSEYSTREIVDIESYKIEADSYFIAVYGKDECVVMFDYAQKGKQNPENQTVKFKKYAADVEVPAKLYSTFDGWNVYEKGRDGKYHIVTEGKIHAKAITVPSVSHYQIMTDTKFVATYKEDTVDVQYYGNGMYIGYTGKFYREKTDEIIQEDVVVGSKLTKWEPTENINPGYEFVGWYKDKALTEEYDFFQDTVTEKDMSLYAKFEAKTYKVVFHKNSDSAVADGAKYDEYYDTITMGETKELKNTDYTREGYKLIGWSHDEAYDKYNKKTGKPYFDRDASFFELDKVGATDELTVEDLELYDDHGAWHYDETLSIPVIDLYAVWAPNKYEVTFDGNGADYDNYALDRAEGDDIQDVLYDDNWNRHQYLEGFGQKLNEVHFEKTGYQFVGWNTEADGSGDAYADQAKLGTLEKKDNNLAVEDGAKVTLYAQWEALEYPVVFYANNGTDEQDFQDLTYDEAANLKAFSSMDFEKDGYYFMGWSTTPDGKVSFNDQDEVLNIATGDWCVHKHHITHEEAKGVKLYAIWSADAPLIATATPNSRTVTMSWIDTPDAAYYEVYGAKCGKYDKVYQCTTTSNYVTLEKLINKNGKKVRFYNGNKYKFAVVAYNAAGEVIETSLSAHTIVGNKSGKTGNVIAMYLSESEYNLEAEDTVVLEPSMKLYGKTKKCLDTTHGAKYRYASSNEDVATVGADGTVTAVGAGTCYIYVYGINGVWAKTKVEVKGDYEITYDE